MSGDNERRTGGDPAREPESTKFGGEARAGQTSSSSGGSTGGEGTMTPEYGGGMGGFLSEGGSTASGDDRQAKVEDDPSRLSARDLQDNKGQDDLQSEPGSDADQANEVPHVG